MKTWLRIISSFVIVAVISVTSVFVTTNNYTYYGITDVTQNVNLPNESVEEVEYDRDENVNITVRIGDGTVALYDSKDRETSFSEFMSSGEAVKWLREMDIKREKVKRMAKTVSPSIVPDSDYTAVFNGFSASIKYGEIENLLDVDGIEEIELDELYAEASGVDDNVDDSESEQSESPSSTVTLRIDNNNIINTSDLDYKGEGQIIAILDTGINLNHEAFAEKTVSEEKAKVKDASYLTDAIVSSLTIKSDKNFRKEELYKSRKIVFAYDYADHDSDVTYSGDSDHGLHVAGIAAGNNGKISSGKFVGVAPQAQLMIFKVFRNNSSGTFSSDYCKAIEDAVKLGADIINLSIGSSSQGFPVSDIITKAVEAASIAGVNVVAAAGNNGRSTKNWKSHNAGKADLPDTAVLSNPGSVYDMMCVANFTKDKKYSGSSSWGPNDDLTLKPEIASIGTSVKSAVAGSSSNYGAKSGTSMATPSIAGHIAIIRQALKEKQPGLSGKELVKRINEIIMSTATVCGSGAPYSPRVQGAGMANIRQALNTTAYLSVEGSNKPKLELGDDPQKLGTYTCYFDVNNFGSQTLTYNLSAKATTEMIANGDMFYNDGKASSGVAHAEQIIAAVFEADGETITSVQVEAGKSVRIKATLSLPKEGDEGINKLAAFENGMFVEGYIYLSGGTSAVNLNIPFLGYYGDWVQASAFDNSVYDKEGGMLYDGALYAEFSDDSDKTEIRVLGKFAYPYNAEKYSQAQNKLLGGDKNKLAISYSYNNDDSKSHNTIKYYKTAFLRSIREAYMTIEDADTGEVYLKKDVTGTVGQMAKSCEKDAKNGVFELKAQFSPAEFNCGGNPVPSGTVLQVKANAVSGYKGKMFGNEPCMNVTVDYEKPILKSVKTENDNLVVEVTDNHYVQAVKLYCLKDGNLVSVSGNNYYTPVFGSGVGKTDSVKFPLSELENSVKTSDDKKLYVKVVDYAFNECVFEVDNPLSSQEKTYDVKITTGKYSSSSARYDGYTKTSDDGATYAKIGDGKYVLLSLKSSKKEFKVKDGTTRICEDAFDAPALTKITLPSSLKRIGYGAFSKCPMLKNVNYDGEYAPVCEIPFSAFSSGEHPYFVFGSSVTLSKRNIADGWEFAAWNDVNIVDRTWTTEFYDDDKLLSSQSGDISQQAQPPVVTKEGYEFLGWYDKNGTKQETFNFNDNKLYAKWKAVYYTITFETDGGSEIMPGQYKFGDAIPSSQRKGYVLSWYDSPDYTNQVISIPSKSCTLYAKWDKIVSTVKVFETQYEKRFEYGDKVEISDISLSKDGYILLGLFTDSALTESAQDFDMPDADVVLYAKWVKEKITITFDEQHDGKKEVKEYRYGEERVLPTPERKGYKFVGWFTDSECTVAYNGEGDEDVTIYAGWEKKKLFDCGTVNFGLYTGVGMCALIMCFAVIAASRKHRVINA